jgi:hypothetical protein
MEVSESHEHVCTEWVKCTTAILEVHLARTIKTSNFRTFGERRASELYEPLAPQERHTSKYLKNTTSSTGWLRPVNLRSPCVQKHARRDVRLALPVILNLRQAQGDRMGKALSSQDSLAGWLWIYNRRVHAENCGYAKTFLRAFARCLWGKNNKWKKLFQSLCSYIKIDTIS